jgi:hypothetical protein
VDDLVRDLAEISGFNAQLANVAPSIEQQVQGPAGVLDPDLKARIAASFGGPALQALVHRRVVEGARRPELDQAVAWFRSPLGNKTTRLELEASTPGGVAAMKAWLEQSAANPPPASRVELVRKLEQAAQVTDTVVLALTATMRPLLLAEAVRLGGLTPQAYDQVAVAMARLEAETRPRVEPMVFQQLLFQYRSLTEQELAQNLDFYLSPAGRWFTAAVRGAWAAAMEEAARRFVGGDTAQPGPSS